MRTAKQIRQDFLEFFAGKDHTVVPSAPVIPHGDPTLLFTNAGMNQFKDVFLGQGTRDFIRAADTQKCIRVSGKHNDLDEVGRDGYHHTFFEMLGNWSFGDYYKRDAIRWAWELLTEVWALPKDRLFVTVYRTDDEAFELWDEVTDIGRDRILRFDEKDNFWEMGDVGPCGPCSEIHFDRTPEKSGRDLVNAGVPEVMEIWNLVFIQHDRQPDGSLVDLPARHVDTGMGFERIVAVLQNKASNYDTDLFRPIIDAIASVTGRAYTADEAGIPHQVIADHIRMTSFAIADGALPSNLGRGYVIRRVLRRAARFGRKLGAHQPFLYRLVPALVDCYGEIFPELADQAEHITRVIQAEEQSFGRTLDRGIQIFEDSVADMPPGSRIPGHVVFQLYDTYGFPVDMTRQMAEERGLSIDEPGYEDELERQKERSRAGTTFKMTAAENEDWNQLVDVDETRFVGYETTAAEARIVRWREVEDDDGQTAIHFILDNTPFYGESGGQIGDTGSVFGDDLLIEVADARKTSSGQTVQIGRIVRGTITAEPVEAVVDTARRDDIRRNHTATHLLHQALRDTLGTHVQQKGSLVCPDYLRFDFSHYHGMTEDEIRQVEDIVNERILDNMPLTISTHPIDEAKAMGAMALFGENYGDIVRVVQCGDYSMELCGGTHCRATGDIGLCRITGESSISAGIRRIEARTGHAAIRRAVRQDQLLRQVADTLRCREDELLDRIHTTIQKLKQAQKENAELVANALAGQCDSLVANAEEIDGVKVVAACVDAPDVPALKGMGDAIREKLGSGVACLAAGINGKAMFLAVVTQDLVKRGIKAGDLIRPIASIAGGGGGGAPHLAQAGGKDPGKLQEAIAAAPKIIRKHLK